MNNDNLAKDDDEFQQPIDEPTKASQQAFDFDEPRNVLLVDVEGNDITEINLNEYSLVHKNTQDAYREKMKREQRRAFDPRGSFVIFKIEANRNLHNLTMQQRSYLMKLTLYVAFEDEPLQKVDKVTGEIIYLTNKEIQEIFWLSRNKTADLMNLYVECGFFHKIQSKTDKRQTHYISTGLYLGKGKFMDTSEYVTKLYQNKLDEVTAFIEKYEVQQAKRKEKRGKNVDRKQTSALGLIHAFVPYFHYQTYYLVTNPHENICRPGESVLEALERRPKALKHMSKAKLCRIAGINDNRTLERYFKVLVAAGAVMVQHTKGKTRYKLHPDLMYRKDDDGQDEYTRFVRTEFDQHE